MRVLATYFHFIQCLSELLRLLGVVGWVLHPPPLDINVLTSRTCEYATLHGNRLCTCDLNKDLEMGKVSWITQRPQLITLFLKVRIFLGWSRCDEKEGGQRDVMRVRVLFPPLLVWKRKDCFVSQEMWAAFISWKVRRQILPHRLQKVTKFCHSLVTWYYKVWFFSPGIFFVFTM